MARSRSRRFRPGRTPSRRGTKSWGRQRRRSPSGRKTPRTSLSSSRSRNLARQCWNRNRSVRLCGRPERREHRTDPLAAVRLTRLRSSMRVVCLGCVGLLVLSLVGVVAASADRRLPDASKNRDRAAIRSLLREHVDVNARHPDGATALHWAAHWDDVETAQLLIRAGAEVNAANDLGVTPLSLACTNGNAAMAAALLEAGANPNLALATGETPLMTAAYTGNAAVVRELLARRADVHAKETGQGQTALMWAVSEQHLEATSTLIAHGADIHARSKGGFTPLLFASRSGNLELGGMLLAA